jgi:hypothetical protein
MDFFRKAADAVGGLILDSDSESDDERGTTTRRAGSSSNTSSKAKTTTHDDHWTDGDVARAASPDAGPDGSFDDSDDEGDEKLIPDAVWGALAAARGKISEVASTVKRDVASAVEVVKHDLSEFNDRAVDETAAFAGDVAAAEYSTGLGLDDDDTVSDGGAARLDADVVDAFDNAVDALDDVGHKVEEFGVKMLGASKRFFHNLKEELTAEDDGSDGSDRDGDGDGDTRGFTSRVGLGAGGAAVAGGGLAARFASDRAAKSKNQSPNDNQNQNKNQNPKAPAIRPPSLEQRVAAMQRDSATYCDEPEDLAGFERWTSGFDVDSPTVSAEVECVLEGNAFMAELQARIVPLVVTREEFWQRYFYALRRIKLEFGVEKEEEDKEAAAESGGDEGKAEEEPEPEPEIEPEVEPEVEAEPEPEAEAEPEPVAEATPASEPPAHPRVSTISAADSAEESGVTSDGSWAKVTSDGEVVEKTETKKKPAVTSEREGTVVAASPPDADLKAPAGDDDIDEDWGMDSD